MSVKLICGNKHVQMEKHEVGEYKTCPKLIVKYVINLRVLISVLLNQE